MTQDPAGFIVKGLFAQTWFHSIYEEFKASKTKLYPGLPLCWLHFFKYYSCRSM